ncbi:MAG: efflux RND transporter periplasmic adaptor subunit [Planctomycetes bacterium]|nr:efflux RND transporter periplasmic adaptor subunit [Planctomycetota bacterium]
MSTSSRPISIACAIAASFIAISGWCLSPGGQSAAELQAAPVRETGSDDAVKVEVVNPRKGGLSRTTIQPGSVHAFEEADLYSQAYGYLKELKVDIGSKVKKGDLLAQIAVPEFEEAVVECQAAVDQAESNILQMKAKVAVAVADQEAAQAAVDRQLAAQKRDEARLSFHEKQFKRVQSLLALKSIDERLVDEKEDQFLASQAALDAAKAAVVSAQMDVKAAAARLGQANADVEAAKAAKRVAESALATAEVRRKFGEIISPYNGVITVRNFHVGDFIRDAQHGGAQPLLRVERTDVMRVVVQVPDREVPFTDVGDIAEVHIDALPKQVFKAKVSRYADSEDQATRTMRTEIDVVNTEGVLRNGMYGRVNIILENPGEGWTVPSTAIVGKVENGKGEIYVVKDGKSYRLQVAVGSDNGSEVEILSGLTSDSQVVTRYNGSIGDKVSVHVIPAKTR